MARTNEISGFQIVLSDGGTEVSTYSIPNSDLVPTKVYATFQDAKQALEQISSKLPHFYPVAYGQAFPYENLSFGKLLYEKGYAAYGWFTLDADDDEGAGLRVCLGLLRVGLVLPAA